MVIAYVLTQVGSACKDFIPRLYATQAFVNEILYEECAPLATFEAASKVIQFEYEEHLSKQDSSENAPSDANVLTRSKVAKMQLKTKIRLSHHSRPLGMVTLSRLRDSLLADRLTI